MELDGAVDNLVLAGGGERDDGELQTVGDAVDEVDEQVVAVDGEDFYAGGVDEFSVFFVESGVPQSVIPMDHIRLCPKAFQDTFYFAECILGKTLLDHRFFLMVKSANNLVFC